MSLKTPIAPRASPQILSDIPFRKSWICPGYLLLAPPLNQPLHGTMEIHGSFHVFILSHACLSITHADDYNCVNGHSIWCLRPNLPNCQIKITTKCTMYTCMLQVKTVRVFL